jgi:predicted transcriptional regulator
MEICADIVGAADGGARKTKMVYQANLNFCVIGRYLDPLIEHGLISEKPPRPLNKLWKPIYVHTKF